MNINYEEVATSIGNCYGSLHIAEHEGKFYWLIENYDTDFDDISEYEEIPQSLYNEIKNLSQSSPAPSE